IVCVVACIGRARYDCARGCGISIAGYALGGSGCARGGAGGGIGAAWAWCKRSRGGKGRTAATELLGVGGGVEGASRLSSTYSEDAIARRRSVEACPCLYQGR